ATSKNLSSTSAYTAVQQQLDITNFIDYMLLNFYVGNTDWSHQNWYASSNRNNPEGRWRFHSWDAEHVLKGINDNSVTKNNGASPTGFHQSLKRNKEYQVLFGDRIHRHFFNNGVLTPEKAAASYQTRLDSIDEAIVAESARWGDNQRSTPFTRDKEWVTEKNRLLKQYFPQRTGIVLDQLRRHKLYPSVAAPMFSQHGGPVAAGFELSLTAPAGEIHFTLDGTDPRLPGGAIADTAKRYSSAVAIVGSLRVKARARLQGEWSALTEALFVVDGSLDTLRVTELMYHPLRGMPEFIELKNSGDATLDLSGVAFREGIRFTFPNGFRLAPGEYVILTDNVTLFTELYPGVTLGGTYDGRLSNGSEKLVLTDSLAKPFLSLTYSDQPPWPSRADGQGFSLVAKPLGEAADPNLPMSWRPSANYGGSPGRNDVPSETGNAPPYLSAGANRIIETGSIPVAVQLARLFRDDAHPAYPGVALKWSLDGEPVPVQFTAANQPKTTATVYGLGRLTFRLTADDGEHTVSDTVTVEVRRVGTERTFIAAGSEWRYLDNGSNQGTRWHARLFNDSNWESGPAQLGYGDNDEKTKLSFGDNSGNKHVTTFFRHAFEVANPAGVTSLEGALLRDDGAVVYLNRREVTRSNMPQGTIGYTTFASTTAGGDDEKAFHSFAIDPALLVPGKNVIAVEVHQANRTSSDISFDFALSGTGSAANQPPTVQPFADWNATWPGAARLVAQVNDDGLPTNPGHLAMRWNVQSGPGTVTFANDSLPVTTARFSQPGRYVLSFSAYDGQTVTNRELVIRVNDDAFAVWRRAHFSDAELGRPKISAPSADPDGDGLANLAEYLAGTRPRDAGSRLAIDSTEIDPAAGTLTIHFRTAPNRRYRLQRSGTPLGPWKTAAERPAPPNGGPAVFAVPLGPALGPAQFFRLEIPAD
ncbi:MAG: lamin tail domain-containing protein, partial [Verrucomicrobiota bacterium]|nr:lamin tail domain-containing protein [Verrucomicrobiota bacterium]